MIRAAEAQGRAWQGPRCAALFEQGAEIADEIPRYELEKIKTGESIPDFSSPFALLASAWVGDAEADSSPFKLALDEFAAAFDTARKDYKGVRVSKVPETALEGAGSSFDVVARIQELFAKCSHVKALEATCSDELTRFMGSFFAIDALYDKVSGESLGVPAMRFTLRGTRKVLITDALQLVNFMVSKNVQGKINLARCASYFKCMAANVLKEYKLKSLLYTGTIAKGDVLYLPYGALAAE